MLPGDQLVTTESGTANGVAATTLNVTAEHAQEVGTELVVHGTAFLADGTTPMDLGSIEQRIINTAFLTDGVGKRDLRATSDGGSRGLITADPLVRGGWIATYDSLTATQRADAVAGETRAMAWQATNAAGERLGLTIFEAGLSGGPGMAECPAQASYSVVGATPNAVNAANMTRGLTLTGAAQDASRVTVTLNDRDAATPPVTASATPTPAAGAQSYSVNFTGAQVAGLADGTLTATSSFVIPTGTISGSSKTVLKDTVVPQAPTSDTLGGQYDASQHVSLSLPTGEDSASTIHYTTDGGLAPATSPSAQPIVISSSKRLRAAVVDAAGNISDSNCASACWEYFIEPTIAAPSKPDLTDATDTGQSRTDNITNSMSPVVNGSGTPGSTVDLMRGSVVVAGATVTPGGLWSISPIGLVDGLNTLTAESYGVHQPMHKASAPLSLTVDHVAPTVMAKAPAAGAVGVSRGANITVRFGEAVTPSSLTPGSAVLRKTVGGAAVRRTLSYSAATRMLTINPGGAGTLRLAAKTRYRVSLASTITDIAGNSLATTSWTFLAHDELAPARQRPTAATAVGRCVLNAPIAPEKSCCSSAHRGRPVRGGGGGEHRDPPAAILWACFSSPSSCSACSSALVRS